MTDDEYDDELPPIVVNSSVPKENQYVMPSADVIASQRAYEEICEQELRQLRSQYESEDVVTVCHDSSGSEGEATLAAAIESMRVQSGQTISQLDAAQLLQKFIANASDWDVVFLQDYLDVLQREDVATVRNVTDTIMYSIEDMVKQSITLDEQGLYMVCLWLCAASLWSYPRVASARSCLHVLLGYFTEQQLQTWCTLVGVSLDSAALVRASDIIAYPRAASTLLLRAALHSLAPQYNFDKIDSQLSVDEVREALAGVWRTLSPAQQFTATQVVGRALVDVVDTSKAPDDTVRSETFMDVTVKSEASIDVTMKSEALIDNTTKSEVMDVAGSEMSMDVKFKRELSLDVTVNNKVEVDEEGKAPIDVPIKTEAADNSAISKLLSLMATQLPQHRYQPDYLRVRGYPKITH